MLQFTQRVENTLTAPNTVTLPIEKRVKSRIRVTLDDGRDAGIVLPRGEQLRSGDKLQSTDGEVVEVLAADESLSLVRCTSALEFARACYHLGNRHVPVEILPSDPAFGLVGTVTFLHDHVLEDMLRGLGLTVESVSAPFNPEPGAYGG